MASLIASQFKYDVYLGYRGPDSRYGFVSNLLKAQSHNQIKTFVDTELKPGAEILPSVARAIEGSHILLIMFSRDHASSKYAYELIQEIVKLVLERLNQPCQGNSYESPLHFDGGKTSVVDESNIHNLSLKGSFRRPIISWRKGEILGRGSYGSVYKGFTNDGFLFAVKEVCLKDKGSQAKQRISRLLEEMSALIQLRHKNIVQYIGMDMDNNNMLYIFLELVTQRSLDRLYQKYNLTDSQVSGYTRQILSGLKYLHDQDVIHRDIKCAIYCLMTMGPSSLQILVWQSKPN